MNGKSMVEGAPWKHILRFALSVLAGSLLQHLYNTGYQEDGDDPG